MDSNTLVKIELHPRNAHRGKYNMQELIAVNPDLHSFVFTNKYGTETIDFSKPEAVRALNAALLKSVYNINFWQIPEGNLCPPIPGRADYLHYIADLVDAVSKPIHCLDIGTGASLIYPVLGTAVYPWNFVASDIDARSLENAQNIISKNTGLSERIKLRLQTNSTAIFEGIVDTIEHFDVVICNPPFHASEEEAMAINLRKVRNLSRGNRKIEVPQLNFAGQAAELWCAGGEFGFIQQMIEESKSFHSQIQWFTSLVSKQENVEGLQHFAFKAGASDIRVIDMATGNKQTRILCWKFD